MNAKEIYDFIIDEMNPLYPDVSSFGERRVYYDFLEAVPVDVLREVYSMVKNNSTIADKIREHIEMILAGHDEDPVEKNEPIGTLIRWYGNKKSKKVRYAFEQLTDRYYWQSFIDQKRILRAFLGNGSKASANWAATRLRKKWIEGFEEDVRQSWEKYRTRELAACVVTHLPAEYVLQDLPLLEPLEEYRYICAKLGNTPGFVMDESRLSTPDWFYVMAKLGNRHLTAEMDERLNRFFLEYVNPAMYVWFGMEETGFPSIARIRHMPLIIWAMKQLNYTEGIAKLCRLQSYAQWNAQYETEERFRVASFVYHVKARLSPNIPDESEYFKERKKWEMMAETPF